MDFANFGMTPSAKYFGEQNETYYGGKVCWPGSFGFPFRGKKIPQLSTDEEASIRLYLTGDFKHKLFDLSKEEDSAYYQWVMDRVCNGLFRLVFSERRWNEETKNMIVYLEWQQLYIEDKKSQEDN